jgi:riboflavin kinase/FMN adenylyltransferase
LKVFYNINEFIPVTNNIVTTGTFDGVHLGHRTILSRLKEIAKREKGETTLLTFHPHPRLVLFPTNQDLKLLNTQKEKIELLSKSGVDNLIIHPFTTDFSRLSSNEFIKNIISNTLKTHKLVIGYDHRFGRNREGSFEHLKEFGSLYGFNVEEIPAQDVDNINVSSTKVRNSILAGDIVTANQYLGYNFSLTGKVITGNKLGRTIGFPTANIQINDLYKIIPKDGVYCVMINTGNKNYGGMLNIGTNPTVNSSNKKSIEVHLFAFGENIYDTEVTIQFVKKLRNEKKFNSIEDLKTQLNQDKLMAMQIL